jgi:hypothetical protein
VELSNLTPQQAQALAARLAPSLGYLVRLTNRMQQAGWRADDPAYVVAWRGWERKQDAIACPVGVAARSRQGGESFIPRFAPT